jgi:hypothetical protein
MPKDRVNLLLDGLRYLETVYGHELALIGNRMTWFAITQSFLFGAYATIATDPARLDRAFRATTSSDPLVGVTTINVLLLVMPVLGIAIALAAFFSVRAAGTVRAHLGAARGDLQKQLNEALKANGLRQIPVIGTREQRIEYGGPEFGRTIFFGRLPEWVLPFAMIAVWTVALGLRLRLQGFTIQAP